MDSGEPAKVKILFVDDNESTRRTTSELLEMMGYSVTTCAYPTEALELLRIRDFDLVMSDVDFGESSTGPEKLFTETLEKGVPLVVFTGAGWELPPHLDGMNILIKPSKPKEITHAIETALAENQNRTKILLVDDNKDLLEDVSWYLQNKGYDVNSCSNPSEAINLINTQEFDAVLSDIEFGLSPVSAETFFTELMDRQIPLVVLTGAGWYEVLSLEGVEILDKSAWRIEDMVEAIEAAIARQEKKPIDNAEIARLANPDWHTATPAIKYEESAFASISVEGKPAKELTHYLVASRALRKDIEVAMAHGNYRRRELDEMHRRYQDFQKKLKALKEKPIEKTKRTR
jgi:CheY-like chemotaxis protein